jgi:hypothetical protein
VEHASPEALVHAFFTNSAIPKEVSGGAREPVIVQCLYHRHIRFATGLVNRGRDHDLSVVDVDEVWILPAQQLAKISPRVARPDGPPHQGQPLNSGIGFNLRVTSTVGNNFVPVPFQELAFLLEDYILAPRLLVVVMNEQYLHEF